MNVNLLVNDLNVLFLLRRMNGKGQLAHRAHQEEIKAVNV